MTMKESRIYRQYVSIFLIFTLIPMLLISLLIYQISIHQLENQMRQNEIHSLKEFQNKSDLALKNINSISLQAALNYMDQNIANDSLISASYDDIKRVLGAISSILYLNDSIKSVYIYSKASDKILTNGGLYDWDSFVDKKWLDLYKTISKGSENEPAVWLPNNQFVSSDTTQSIKSMEGTTLVRPFPITEFPKTGYVVIKVDMKNLYSTFISSPGSKYLITSSQNEVMYDSDSIMNNSADIALNKPSVKINGKNMLVLNVSSPFNGWRYISLVDRGALLTPLKPLQRLIYIILILSSITIVCLSIMASKVIYKPIKKAFGDFLVEKNHFEALLHKHDPMIKEGVVLKLLRGEFIDPHNIDMLDFQCKEFVVVSFENYVKEGDYPSNHITINASLKNILSLKLGDRFKYLSTSVDAHTCSVILFFKEEGYLAEHKEIIHSIFVQILVEAVHQNIPYLAAGIGNPCYDLNDINQSFANSLQALKYRLFAGENSFLFYQDIKSNHLSNTISKSTIDLDKKLVSFIKEGNAKGVENIIASIIEEMTQSHISPEYVYGVLNHIRDMLFDIPLSLGYNPQEILAGNNVELYNRYKYLKNIQEIKSYFIEIASCILKGLELKKNNKNGQIILSIKKYIGENIAEDISLNAIADKFNISAPYLSTIFKQETGDTFINYVISVKMELAKNLLTETSISVNKISERVGYFNNHGFYNIFKKYTGQTPSQFRSTFRTSNPASTETGNN